MRKAKNGLVPSFIANALWLNCTPAESEYTLEKASGILRELTGEAIYVRKHNNPDQLYEVKIKEVSGKERELWSCYKCKEAILFVVVAHPIENIPYSDSKFIRSWYERVPYCPKCEDKPKFMGSNIKTTP